MSFFVTPARKVPGFIVSPARMIPGFSRVIRRQGFKSKAVFSKFYFVSR